MRYYVCNQREDGDYDILTGFETDTLGEDVAREMALASKMALAQTMDFELELLHVIKWQEYTDVIPGVDEELEFVS